MDFELLLVVGVEVGILICALVSWLAVLCMAMDMKEGKQVNGFLVVIWPFFAVVASGIFLLWTAMFYQAFIELIFG